MKATFLEDLENLENNPDYCKVCGIEHAGEDDREHIVRHRKFIKATQDLLYVPSLYHAQEHEKSKGWDLFYKESSLEDNINGALLVLRTHFDRSLIAGIDGDFKGRSYYKIHPSFEEYISHACLEYLFEKKTEVIKELRKTYGKSKFPLEDGSTYWKPRKLK